MRLFKAASNPLGDVDYEVLGKAQTSRSYWPGRSVHKQIHILDLTHANFLLVEINPQFHHTGDKITSLSDWPSISVRSRG